MGRITIDDVLAQGRLLLLDPQNGPVVPAPSVDPAASRLREVRIPGKGPGIGMAGWLAGEGGFPFGALSATISDKTHKVAGHVVTDWTAWLYVALATEVDGFTDLAGWARGWDDALDQWFPQTYRLGALGQSRDLGDLWWLYKRGEIGVFPIADRPFYGLVARLAIRITNTVTWGVGLSTVP